MVKKDTATSDSQAREPAVTAPARPQSLKAEVNTSGFYCYIGPNLVGLLQSGAIFRGARTEALAAAAAAIEKEPLVKTLIISGDNLPEARLKVKTPGNALYANYRKIAGKQ